MVYQRDLPDLIHEIARLLLAPLSKINSVDDSHQQQARKETIIVLVSSIYFFYFTFPSIIYYVVCCGLFETVCGLIHRPKDTSHNDRTRGRHQISGSLTRRRGVPS